MRALVTGCAGFIGSHLVESLLQDRHEVVGIDCFNDNYGRRQKLRNLEQALDWGGFDFVPIDLSRGQLAEIVAEVDTIFHLAAEPGVRPSWGQRFEQYVRNNVLATQHVLEAARECGGDRRFVYASSSSIYGQAEALPTTEDAVPAPFSPYGVTKLSGENLAMLYAGNYGLDCVSLRYFSVYGPRQRPDMAFRRFCEAALEGRPLEVYGDGGQTRDFTFVGDIVAATRAAADAPDVAGTVMNIGGGSSVRLDDAIAILAELAGRELEVRRTGVQKGDVRDTAANIDRARSLIAFEPSVGLAEGLAAEWEWTRSHIGRQALA